MCVYAYMYAYINSLFPRTFEFICRKSARLAEFEHVYIIHIYEQISIYIYHIYVHIFIYIRAAIQRGLQFCLLYMYIFIFIYINMYQVSFDQVSLLLELWHSSFYFVTSNSHRYRVFGPVTLWAGGIFVVKGKEGGRLGGGLESEVFMIDMLCQFYAFLSNTLCTCVGVF